MPKDVVWRHRDVFFAALRRAYPGASRSRRRPTSSTFTSRPRWLPRLLQPPPRLDGSPRCSKGAASSSWDDRPADAGARRCGTPSRPRRYRARHRAPSPAGRRRNTRPSARSVGPRAPADRCLRRRDALPRVRQDLLRHLPSTAWSTATAPPRPADKGSMRVWPGRSDGGLRGFMSTSTPSSSMPAGRPAAPGTGLSGRIARRATCGWLSRWSRTNHEHVSGDRRCALGDPRGPRPGRGGRVDHTCWFPWREFDQLWRGEDLPRRGRGGPEGSCGRFSLTQWSSACRSWVQAGRGGRGAPVRPHRRSAPSFIAHCDHLAG